MSLPPSIPLPLPSLPLQLVSQLVEDIYYACEDTAHMEGLLPLTYGQAVEILDISDGDLWLVKTVDAATGKSVEGMVRASSLVSTPPGPPKQNGATPPPQQNGGMPLPQQNGTVVGEPLEPAQVSATTAVLPGSLFGRYEPPRSMIFGKPVVKDGEIVDMEEAVEREASVSEQAPPPSMPVIRLQSPEAAAELLRLQEASVNSQQRLDDFDPVEMYVAIADFEATEESNVSLKAGQRMQVGGGVWFLGHVTVT